MSNKEYAMQLLDSVPDYKMGYVLAYLKGLLDDEKADDDYCEMLLNEYKKDDSADKNIFYSIDEAAKKLGISIDELSN